MADSTKRYVAVDLGASGGKVVLASVAGGKVTTETVHSFSIPCVTIAGQVYWDIYAAYSGVLEGLSAIGSRKVSVESIGIDAWVSGVVCMASDGDFLNLPQLGGDILSESYHSKFFRRMERRELYETTGVNILDSHAALQLYGLRRSKSVALEMAKNLLFIPDAMAYLLTGKRFCDYTSLYAAGLVDRGTKKLSRDVLSACKVKARRFPSVVQQGSKPAKLTEEAAEATGLGRVPVVAGIGHGLASAAAAAAPVSPVTPDSDKASLPGVFSSAEGTAFLMTGAMSVLGIETASPIVNDQTFEMDFSNEAGVGGVNLLVKRISGCDILDKCLKQWDKEGKSYSVEDIARMALEGPETNAQLDPEDATLMSSPDMPAAIKRYCSLRSMSAPADDAAVVRLIYASLTEKIGNTFTKLQSVTPFRLKSLTVIGKGALDPVLCQMVADECAVPVTAGPSDAAVLGNVLVQAGLTRAALASSFTPVTYTPGL